MRKALLPLLLTCGLIAATAGCVNREGVIRQHLVQAGIPESLARCMADPLNRELSDEDLRKLAQLAGTVKGDPARMSYGQVLSALSTLGDRHLTEVSLRTAAGCALRP